MKDNKRLKVAIRTLKYIHFIHKTIVYFLMFKVTYFNHSTYIQYQQLKGILL